VAADVSDLLGIQTVVSPPNPGNLSALGLQVSDIRREYVRTCVRRQSTVLSAEVDRLWRELLDEAAADLEDEGVAPEDIRLMQWADVRYVGEGYEVPVKVPVGIDGEDLLESLWADFHKNHKDRYGYSYEGEQEAELVNLRVSAVGLVHRPPMYSGNDRSALSPLREDTRLVYWRDTGWVRARVVERSGILPGWTAQGPIIVEEYGSTVVVPGSWRVVVDSTGNLILRKESRGST
jgi:N-methylhydantoinase A